MSVVPCRATPIEEVLRQIAQHEQLIDDLLSAGAVDLEEYVTNTELQTGLDSKADISHDHNHDHDDDYAAAGHSHTAQDVQGAYATMGGGQWTTTNTNWTTIPNLQCTINATRVFTVVFLHLPVYVVLTSSGFNAQSRIVCNTDIAEIAQFRTANQNSIGWVGSIGGFAMFSQTSGGNKIISAGIKVGTGGFSVKMNGEGWRQPRIVAMEYGQIIG